MNTYRLLLLGLCIGCLGATAAPAQPCQDHARHASSSQPASAPTSPGQEAFGAIAEIVALLEADPSTDWQSVSIDRLREHLVDMDDLVLRAETRQRDTAKGVEIEVTGEGRTREAIRRMVPAHAAMMRQARPWRIEVETMEQGVKLTLESDDPGQVAKLRGLGFFGFMASEDHHQPHHLAMARGEMMH